MAVRRQEHAALGILQVARPPGPGIKERRIRLEILTLGRDLATVNLEFKVRGQDQVGRQSQTWVRFPDVGWKVVSAHVSTTDGSTLWSGGAEGDS